MSGPHRSKTPPAPPHNSEASLMFKVMEVMASLNKDTMAKACRKTFNRIVVVVDDGGTFIKTLYKTYPNEHFQKVSPKMG